MSNGTPVSEKQHLKGRHVQFIAIGGAIGAGLFLGSGSAIAAAGPAVILTYAVAGLVMFFMARALGELTLNLPSATSFTEHVEELLGDWAGFVTGWSYWLIWVLVGIAELTASGMFLRYWFPSIHLWAVALTVLVCLYGVNRMAVRFFGEIEFWLTAIKVATILGLILFGLLMVLLETKTGGGRAGFSNLWRNGGFMPLGFLPLVAAMPASLFAFGGTELIGITAAETGDPNRAVPRAVNGVVLRILLFYVGSLTIIMAAIPWNSIRADQSPFILLFTRMGLPAAAALINLVVLSAVISSCNSGIYATGRVLFSLAAKGQAPKRLHQKDRDGLPANAITASASAMLLGVAMNYLFPTRVFAIVMSLVAALLLWTWGIIAVAHLRYRQQRPTLAPRFPMPFYPVSNFVVLLFVLAVAVMLSVDRDSRVTVFATVVWLGLLSIYFLFCSRQARA